MPNEISVHGVFLPASSAEEKLATHQALYDSMSTGGLSPIVGATFGLAEADKAHAEIVAPSAGGKVGNIVVIVREESD